MGWRLGGGSSSLARSLGSAHSGSRAGSGVVIVSVMIDVRGGYVLYTCMHGSCTGNGLGGEGATYVNVPAWLAVKKRRERKEKRGSK